MNTIDVSHLVDIDCGLLSGSRFELGENAGQITWRNSMEQAAEKPLVTDADGLSELRDWIAQWGAWTRAEIDSWSDQELNAILAQFVAGNLREMERFSSWQEYQAAVEYRTCSSDLWRDEDGGTYFDISN